MKKEYVTRRSPLPSCYSFSSRASVTKIHTIRLKSRLPFSGKMIFRYVIFDVYGYRRKSKCG
nr:hypothetical protein [uncultured bacterium]